MQPEQGGERIYACEYREWFEAEIADLMCLANLGQSVDRARRGRPESLIGSRLTAELLYLVSTPPPSCPAG